MHFAAAAGVDESDVLASGTGGGSHAEVEQWSQGFEFLTHQRVIDSTPESGSGGRNFHVGQGTGDIKGFAGGLGGLTGELLMAGPVQAGCPAGDVPAGRQAYSYDLDFHRGGKDTFCFWQHVF